MAALNSHTQRSKRAFFAAILLFVIGIVFSGCRLDLPQSTLNAAGDVARSQQDLFVFIFWISAVIFVIIQGLLIFIVFRFRRRRGHEDDIPTQTHGSTALEIGWTIAPAILVIAITIPIVKGIAPTYDPPVALAGERSIAVEVVGHQWWWEYRYFEENGELDFVTANEMHIPVNAVVNLTLTSVDVIHSFSIPRLAGTRDVIPGRENRMWFRATEEGKFEGQCKEFCGASHALMRTFVVSESQDAYEAWAEGQRSLAVAVTVETQPGWDVFQAKGCVGCHTVEGTDAAGTIGPNLTHYGARTTIAANILNKDDAGENLSKWLRNPPGVKPGSIMPNLNLSESDIASLVVFLESLK